MEEVLNPISGRMTKVRWLEEYSQAPWRIVQCEETGFVFLANPPSYEDLATEFAWETTFQEEKQKRAESEPVRAKLSGILKRARARWLKKRDPMFAMANRFVSEQFKNDGQNGYGENDNRDALRLLDVGAGKGHRIRKFCQLFAERGIEVEPSGIEISPELAKISNAIFQKLGGQVVANTALHGMTEFEPESFDVVIMQCYLEHEAQPLEVLRRTLPVLSERGVVLVKVPNFDSWNRSIRGKRWCGFRFPDHVNYFTSTTLEMLCQEAGFEMLPQPMWDRLPTSDNMYAVLRKPKSSSPLSRAA